MCYLKVERWNFSLKAITYHLLLLVWILILCETYFYAIWKQKTTVGWFYVNEKRVYWSVEWRNKDSAKAKEKNNNCVGRDQQDERDKKELRFWTEQPGTFLSVWPEYDCIYWMVSKSVTRFIVRHSINWWLSLFNYRVCS